MHSLSLSPSPSPHPPSTMLTLGLVLALAASAAAAPTSSSSASSSSSSSAPTDPSFLTADGYTSQKWIDSFNKAKEIVSQMTLHEKVRAPPLPPPSLASLLLPSLPLPSSLLFRDEC